MPYAKIGSLRVYYEEHGAQHNETVILLHGGGSTMATFSLLAHKLQQTYRVLAYETRGHGRSDDAREVPFSYDLLAADVVNLLYHLQIESVHIVGWSDGAIIGIHLAMNNPGLCKSLVLIGANFHIDGLEPKFVQELQECSTEADWTKLLGEESLRAMRDMNPQGDPSYFIDHVCPKLKHLWTTEPLWTEQDIKQIPQPVLLIAGDDECIRIEHTVRMLRSFQKAQLLILPATTHMIHEEKPQPVNDTIHEFLCGVSSNRDVQRFYIP